MKSQSFHEKGKHHGILNMEMERATIALPLKNTIANSILRHWIWLSPIFKTTVINRGYATYKNLESLLCKVANQGDYSAELQEVVSFYGDDVNEVELTTQLQILSAKFAKDFQPDSPYTLKMVLSFLRDLSAGQRIFYKQVCNVARLVIVIPSTNAASERSFSVMRRIKNYLRSTMTQARLNHLMILNVYKELLDELDLKVIANLFVQGSEHRLTIFGTF